jgi:CheY-like chemotaxis protein
MNSPPPLRRLLIVEDNADSRRSLQTLLELLGHRVEAAADGQEGVDMALAGRPDVAVVDIGLPRLDGYEVARRVRAALGAAVRLIALTAYTQPEYRRRAIEAGFDHYLTKPLELSELQALLA